MTKKILALALAVVLVFTLVACNKQAEAPKVIGVQTGTTGDIYCTDDFGEEAVKRFDNGALAVQALLNNQVCCVVIDNEPAKAFVAANDGLKILETEYAVEDYAIAINKDNTELLEKVNAALAELKADGTIDKIVAKYINPDNAEAYELPKAETTANGKLVMGTNAAFPPYEYVEGDKIVGIDAEIAAAIAAKLGMELEIKDMAFDSLIPAVAGGSIDIVLAGMTVTDERKESVNFSDSYATGIQSVIVKADSDVATIDDIMGGK